MKYTTVVLVENVEDFVSLMAHELFNKVSTHKVLFSVEGKDDKLIEVSYDGTYYRIESYYSQVVDCFVEWVEDRYL